MCFSEYAMEDLENGNEAKLRGRTAVIRGMRKTPELNGLLVTLKTFENRL